MIMEQQDADSWAGRAHLVLSDSGHRAGQARRALIECLDSQTCARTVLEIEDALRAGERPIARASIYRILDELEGLHLVQKVQVGQDTTRYEPIRAGAGHHHHLVCDSCGAVTPFTDDGLEAAISKLSSRLPMEVSEHEIVLRGACESCAA
jgi:Fur family ferric uptake transcriptional regulator